MENPLQPFRILVVEDEALTRKLLVDILTRLGFGTVIEASNAVAALRCVEQQTFDIILCDWRMEPMSGLEFTHAVRNSGKDYALTPIVMVTGNTEKHHVEHARDSGVNVYLTKPFSVKELCDKLKAIVENPREFVLAPGYKGPSRRNRYKTMNRERRRNRVKPRDRNAPWKT